MLTYIEATERQLKRNNENERKTVQQFNKKRKDMDEKLSEREDVIIITKPTKVSQ